MGRIVDVVVDRDGRPRAAVIDFGGFLGVGSRKIAVDWSALTFAHDKAKRDLVTLELTRDQVKAAPEYKEGSAVVVLGARARNAEPGAESAVSKPQARRSEPVRRSATVGRPWRRTTERRAVPARERARRRCRAARRRAAAASVAHAACAASTGSSSSSPTCRPGSARSSRSI